MRGALALILGLMKASDTAWDALRSDAMQARTLMQRVILPLSVLTALAWSTGTALMPLVAGTEPAFAGTFVKTFLLCMAAIGLLTVGLAVPLPMYRRERAWRHALLLALASAVPMLLCGVLLFYPRAVLVMVPAALHAACLIYSGSQRLLGVEPADAAEYSAVAMLFTLFLTMGFGALVVRLGFA